MVLLHTAVYSPVVAIILPRNFRAQKYRLLPVKFVRRALVPSWILE